MVRIFNLYKSPKSIVLMLLEATLIACALVCGVRIRFWGNATGFDTYLNLPDFAFQAAVFVITIQLCFYYCDLYDLTAVRTRNEQMIALGQSLGSGCLLLGILYFIFPALLLGRGIFFISLVLVPAFVACSRFGLDWVWQAAAPNENMLILGTGKLAYAVGFELAKRRD